MLFRNRQNDPFSTEVAVDKVWKLASSTTPWPDDGPNVRSGHWRCTKSERYFVNCAFCQFQMSSRHRLWFDLPFMLCRKIMAHFDHFALAPFGGRLFEAYVELCGSRRLRKRDEVASTGWAHWRWCTTEKKHWVKRQIHVSVLWLVVCDQQKPTSHSQATIQLDVYATFPWC